ncbi:MAG: RNA polymerase subunit sigma-24 [Acidobacteria bacterium]|nr:MAG: RNA polymerase subunit sigma-24 [Acidobacteriota bacterium]RLE24649.1 MAG: RNA polymerase subunit sigma-24 [Acidobacteriota bacterium]
MDVTEELQVIDAVLKGDVDRYEALVNRYQKPIINFIFRMVGNYEDATELAQDVFIKSYVSLAGFNRQYRFSTWLFRIATNRAIDFLRKRKVAVVSMEGDYEDYTPQYKSDGSSPLETLEDGRLKTLLGDAIQQLPPEYREVIVLYHVTETSYEEIAEITGLPLGTVKNRIFRARKMLKKILEGEI